MMNAAARAARAACLYSSGQRAKAVRRSLATARAEALSSSPEKTYSENEFPDRQEAPVITRTNAADVEIPTKKRTAKTAQYTISSSRRIGPTRPEHIPPNAPFESLENPETQVTTLPNRVGPMENYSQVSTVAVLADFGSRHELDGDTTTAAVSTSGVNHLMELLAFQSTKHNGGEEVRNIMEKLGGAHCAASSREQMLWGIDVLRPNVRAGFEMLADTVKCPMIDAAEVEEMKEVTTFQATDIMPQFLVGEGLHMAAYGPRDGALQQLGRPHFCAPEALPHLLAQSIHAFRERCLLRRPGGSWCRDPASLTRPWWNLPRNTSVTWLPPTSHRKS